MRRFTLTIFIMMISINLAFPVSFYKFIPSSKIDPTCTVQKEDERGGYGIDVKEGNIDHVFLVFTGVYYETCKDFEKEINRLRKKHSHLLVHGTEGSEEESGSRVWRWRSIRSPRFEECISYFAHDCPERL